MVRPVPIPNTAVKHSLADGSGSIGSARVGCRQSFSKSRRIFLRLFYFCHRLSSAAPMQGGRFVATALPKKSRPPLSGTVRPRGKSADARSLYAFSESNPSLPRPGLISGGRFVIARMSGGISPWLPKNTLFSNIAPPLLPQ